MEDGDPNLPAAVSARWCNLQGPALILVGAYDDKAVVPG